MDNNNQQYDQYGRPIQNQQQMNEQWNNQYNQQWNSQYNTQQPNTGNIQQAYGINANQNVYGRVEQNNLYAGQGYTPYKKSKAGLFITLGILGTLAIVGLIVVMIITKLITGLSDDKDISNDYTNTAEVDSGDINDYIIDTSMADKLSFKEDEIKVDCLGLTDRDLLYSDDNYYLVFEIDNNLGLNLKASVDAYVNNFYVDSFLVDDTYTFMNVIEEDSKVLAYLKVNVDGIEDLGLSQDDMNSYKINWEFMEEKDYDTILEKCVQYNTDDRYVADTNALDDFELIYGYNDDIKVWFKLTENESEPIAHYTSYCVNKTSGEVSIMLDNWMMDDLDLEWCEAFNLEGNSQGIISGELFILDDTEPVKLDTNKDLEMTIDISVFNEETEYYDFIEGIEVRAPWAK